MKYQHLSKKPDYVFIFLLGAVVFIGLLILSSASVAIGLKKFGDNYHFLKQQVLHGLIPGLALFFVCAKINYRFWKKVAWPLLLASVFLLALVLVPSVGKDFGSGARSWVAFLGISFQPSEIAKLTFLIYLAAWFDEKGKKAVKSWRYGFLQFLMILGVVGGLVFLEPDLGTFFILVIIALTVYFIAGAGIKQLLLMAAMGAGTIFLAVKLAAYRMERLTVFLNSDVDPRGIGYHINQALIAIGSGGWFGLGLGESRQKFQYLPEAMGDSIFAIMAEELGFVLTFGFIAVFLILIYRGLKIARKSKDDFSRYLAAGIASWWFFQAVINIGGMLKLLPMTGLPLPFVSLGGTALAVSLAAAGIVVNVSKNSNR